jgi:Holliday junction resolvase-like predicted endonuclease
VIHADYFALHISGGALGCSQGIARGWRRRWRRIGSAEERGAVSGSARRDVRILVPEKARVCICGTQLRAARPEGELDLVGYDGEALAFVEVRTRTVREELSALPELSVTPDKQRMVIRTAKRFLAERHPQNDTCRFDVLAIDNHPGMPPVVRLHKDAFSPQL